MTETERKLWAAIRARQIDGHKFRRQHPVGPYVVDFVCLDRRLVIEVDGPTHVESGAHDAERSAYLDGRGLSVWRVSVAEIDDNLDGVLDYLRLLMGRSSHRFRLRRDHLPICGEVFLISP